jgi:hypothetical protein
MDDNALMVVVASRKELSVYGSEYRFVSAVFQPGSRSQARELTRNADSLSWNVSTQEY